MRVLGRALKVAAVGITVGALTLLSVPLTASAAAPSWTTPPTRLYMLPTENPGTPPPGAPSDVPQNQLDFDDAVDPISGQARTLNIESAEAGCSMTAGNNYAFTGCTAVQFTVSHGTLVVDDPANWTEVTDNAGPFVRWQLPGGAFLRDFTGDPGNPADYPLMTLNLIGTTSQLNAALDTVSFIPDEGYNTFDDGNATLHAVMVPGDGALSTATIDVELKVLNWNAFPEITRPFDTFEVADGQELELGVDTDWAFDDDDNNENDGDGHLDGPNSEFLMAAWVSCGMFRYVPAAGFTTYTNTADAIASYIGAPADDTLWSDAEIARIGEFEAQIPAAVLGRNLQWDSNGSDDFHSDYLAIVDQWDDVEYALQNLIFLAEDEVSGDPIADTTCTLDVWVTDLGNNGLPHSYVIPPEDADPAANDDPYEVPELGYDLVTNEGQGVESISIKVGEPEIELTLTGDTALVEGGSGNLSLGVSPAEHGAFTVGLSTVPAGGAVAGTDYTQLVSVDVPENAANVQIPIDALNDVDVDPGESYAVLLNGTVPGYIVTLADGDAVVLITDTDSPVDIEAPTASIGQAASQLDPTSFLPIIFTVVFSEAVTGFGDEPDDVSFVGSTAGGVLHASVTGSGDTYEVEVTGATTSGLVKISVPAGAAEDAASNPSEAAIPGDNSVQYVKPAPGDVTKPTVTINQAAGQVSPANVEPVVFDVVFSEPVVGFEGGDVTLNGTALPSVATVTGSGAVYQVLVTGINVAGTVIADVQADAAMDASGNTSFASTSTDNSVDWVLPDPGDTTAPTVVVAKGQAQADPTSSDPIVFDVEFSEQVVGFDSTDVTFGGAALPTGVTVTGVGPAYEVKVTGMSVAGNVTVFIAAGVASDAAGNGNEASPAVATVDWELPAADVTPPTGTINQAASQADPTSFDPIKFTVVFSEPVTGLTASDVVLSGTNAGTLVPLVNGSGDTYEITVGGMNGDGTVIANIGANAVNDLGGNPNAALTFTDNSVLYNEPPAGDVTPPHGDIHLAPGQADPTNVTPVVFELTFDEEVSGLTDDDIILAGSANPTAAVVSGSGPYLITVSGMNQSGQVNIGLVNSAVFDSVGNLSGLATNTDNSVDYTLVVDTTAPTVTVDKQPAQDDPTSIPSIVFDVVFDEAVVDFDATDLTLGGTALPTTAVIGGSGPAYTVTVTGMSVSGTVVLSLAADKVHDAANNGNAASTSTDNSVDYTLDTTAPTVTVEKAGADPTTSSPVVFTVQFSEAVSGLSATDFDTSASTVGGSLNVSVLTVDADTYTVSVDGMTAPAGNVVLSLAADKVTDAANNGNAASTSVDNVVAWSPDLGPLAFSFVPPDINVQAAEGDSGANVNFATPTTTGGVPPVTVVCDAASGDFFPIGTTTVTCTATDSAEVQLFTVVQASFDITVTAAPPPPGGGLPTTGAAFTGPMTALALMLLAGGGLVLLFVRRRTA